MKVFSTWSAGTKKGVGLRGRRRAAAADRGGLVEVRGWLGLPDGVKRRQDRGAESIQFGGRRFGGGGQQGVLIVGVIIGHG